MFTALKALFTSKTTWLTVIGAAAVVLVAKIVVVLGLSPDMQQTVVTGVASLFGIKGLQQGLADFGKNQIPPAPPTP